MVLLPSSTSRRVLFFNEAITLDFGLNFRIFFQPRISPRATGRFISPPQRARRCLSVARFTSEK
jgi:hypothetical protein